MLSVRIRHLPTDSAVNRLALDGSLIDTRELAVLVDLWETWTGKRHWLRPEPKVDPEVEAERGRKLEAAQQRARERREAIRRGEIT